MELITDIRAMLAAKSTIEPSGCWLWDGQKDRDGYGRQKVSYTSGQKTCSAHILSYEVHVGPVPAGLQLDHRCRVRHCVNPDHLEPVTSRVNTLRSPIAPAVLNSQKTHCVAGHELSGANVTICVEGHRRCKECRRVASAKYRARQVPTP